MDGSNRASVIGAHCVEALGHVVVKHGPNVMLTTSTKIVACVLSDPTTL